MKARFSKGSRFQQKVEGSSGRVLVRGYQPRKKSSKRVPVQVEGSRLLPNRRRHGVLEGLTPQTLGGPHWCYFRVVRLCTFSNIIRRCRNVPSKLNHLKYLAFVPVVL